MDHTQRIRDFILDTFLFTDDSSAINDDDSFLDKGIIDSTGVLELVMFLENELGVPVADRQLFTGWATREGRDDSLEDTAALIDELLDL